ncbi:PKD domain-containing protein [Flavihumibacter sp. UBA7668]|uniref:PKD domain-containing protein n=1 Tax=Flavihumibacter sp. UBA7668 TaxID=1946542 RepID=UPI0025BADAA2|nr:PKD domain-containing protein [Flavihumibacter sp. UBA7668]
MAKIKPYHFLRIVLACLLIFVAFPVLSQLKADFTIDKPGGCAPHAVSFTNTSTGTTAATSYSWSFGNGNTSALKNPGATYNDEKVYSVTLTAKDGSQSSTKTLQVTVYKKPEVDFSSNVLKGCAPLAVELSSSSTAGNGTISSYFWDFGDGGLQQGAGLQKISHTYQNPQKASISLTVTNSHGCFRTLEKPALVEIFPALTAGFNVASQVVCKENDPVSFSNTSTGPGNLTYAWDFGDGSTSTAASPTHTYNKKGKFDVKLTVKNEYGCVATSATVKLSVADFTADFKVPALICNGNSFVIQNTSTPAPAEVSWSADDGSSAWSNGNSSVNFVFYQPGKRKLTMNARYGNCIQSVTKEVDVKTGPDLDGFVLDLGSSCGAPQTVKLKDTTSSAVKWSWSVDFSTAFASTKEASYTFPSDRSYYVTLKVENAAGCVSNVSRYINIYKPNVSITLLSGAQSGCINLKNKFGTYQSEEIESYQWDFGDGGTSTQAEPEHVFTKEGAFNVKLSFTTKSGCKGTATTLININKRPVADFKTDPTTICGNTPHRFTNLTTGYTTGYRWEFYDFQPTTYIGNDAIHQFQNAGKYSVQLIAYNGNCLDTMSKTDYVEVKPGFPDVTYSTNTCDDTRGEVTIYQASRDAETYTWDFGDGSPPVSWANGQEYVRHTYSKSGSFKVKLTITNGSCTVSDSLDAPVLLKQNPVLSSAITELCSSSSLDIKITGMDNNPRPVSWYYGTHYMVNSILYQDGSQYENLTQSGDYWTTTYNGRHSNLDPAKKGIQAVLLSHYFGCYDTTNLLPLIIKGPIADFKMAENFFCFKDSAHFIDQSIGQNNVPIVKWEWSFGDNSTASKNNNAPVTHLYKEPQQYYAKLKVTDAEGCHHSTGDYSKSVRIYGPKASFNFSPARVIPQTTVGFYSTSNTYPYNSIDYRWRFQDGTTAAGYYADKYYPGVTNDTVRLIARDITTGCRDTAYKVVAVKDVSAGFSYTTSYINNNNCPPVVASFTNTSDNYQSIRWDFGNGRSAGNLNNVSSTYDLPGLYTVTIYAYGFNNTVDSLKVPIEIKGPYAILSADTLFGCQDLTVQLNAVVRNASSFTWDFGDGTLLQTTDTFAVHTYRSPGIYQPALILKDPSGCAGNSKIDDKIIIDQLLTKASADPAILCDSGFVQLNPEITSLAASELGLPLSYRWESGHGQQSDLDLPSFYYNSPGTYEAGVEIVSPFGCKASSVVSLEVVPTTKASIQGPGSICANTEALFTATADRDGVMTWTWDFGGTGAANQQHPAAIRFANAGNYPIQLILAHNGCSDTTVAQLIVNPNPEIGLTPKDPVLCLGNSVRLTARDGVQYNWRAADGIASLNSPNPFVSPEYTTTYQVTVTNSFGCFSRDSTTVTVGRPFTIQLAEDTSVCRGLSVNLPVTGANTYKWILGDGLSSATSSTPVATPVADTRYTVVGYDAYNCFTDTAHVNVVVRDLPTVNAGGDLQLFTGERVELKPVYSSDVVRYNWTPQWYLQCTTCPYPIAAPKDDYTYTVTVQNQYGCIATDDIAIKLVCAENVSIPNAFSPNNDGRNDLFNMMGKGIKKVKSFRVFSRLGDVVFERTNFQIGDREAGWNGAIKGNPAPTGTYVYFAEFICDSGELFTRKGTIVITR